MNDNEPVTGPILSVKEAKKRFFLYVLLRFGGLGAIFGGVFLAQGGVTVLSALLLAFGAASLFVRPRMLGLTTRPEA
jgi:hypothetical protein